MAKKKAVTDVPPVPPVDIPPVTETSDTPPVDTPPVDTPPVTETSDTPPVDTPPVVDVATVVDTPPVTDVVDTPPVDTPPITDTVDAPPADTPPVDTPPVSQAVPQVAPHYKAFFEQYISLMKVNKNEQAIKAASNCIKSMLVTNDEAVFSEVFGMFKSESLFLVPTVMLRATASLPVAERPVVEVVFTIFHILINNSKAGLNMEYARQIIKNTSFITWLAKQLNAANS